ncbi:MAG: hypothetical protein KKB82_05630 [Candidatus Omnitrophica bacterium]|nr:hypothetical protein [Candidatus Omnitrophota bacterium]MBU1925387.1 hypothetical protein [Candidatus Omnitrophota bacterium]MBU2063625.1 hypothetical protein [Candidatus Omnitrophota bacterium]
MFRVIKKRLILNPVSVIIIILAVFVINYNGVYCFSQAENKSQNKEHAENEVKKQELIVYYDKNYPDNHYHPSGRIGDAQDLKFDDGWENMPVSGKTCVRIEYRAQGDFGWVGLYWLNPELNWGNQRGGGYDLRFAKKLTFWAKGEKGGEHIAVFKFGGIKGLYTDSDNHGIGPLVLTADWKQYTVDVSKRNMRYISAGFSFALTKAHNREGCVFYIDDIKYE